MHRVIGHIAQVGRVVLGRPRSGAGKPQAAAVALTENARAGSLCGTWTAGVRPRGPDGGQGSQYLVRNFMRADAG